MCGIMEQNIQIPENNPYVNPGKVIIFDKPLTWTSFDTVNKVRNAIRRTFNIKKIKVGHAGTLDPLATGVLIVCTGKRTKEITSFQDRDKEYIANIRCGATTASYDLEHPIENIKDISHLTREMIEEALKKFIGVQIQYPPVFSAKKIDGKRAYEKAHKGNGDQVKIRPQEIEIKELEIIEYSNEEFQLRVACSKGTYIRSLAHDLGQVLGTGAYLAGLRRTRIGNITLENAVSPQQFEELLKNEQTNIN